MASVAEEIAIKLGVKTGDLKAALSDAGASIKKFKKEGESTESEGLLGSLKKQVAGLNNLKQLFLGGAIAGAVKGFFQLAIDSANASTDATDKNAAAVREFGRELEQVKGVAATVAVATVGTFNRIGSAIGDLINFNIAFAKGGQEGVKIWNESRKLAEETAKGAEEVEARLAEVRKKHGAEFLAITKELKDLEQKSQEQKLKGLDIFQTERNLFLKIADLKTQLENGDLTILERRRLILELARTQLTADEATLAVKKEHVAEEKKYAEEQKKAAEDAAKAAEEDRKNRQLEIAQETELAVLVMKAAEEREAGSLAAVAGTKRLTAAERERLEVLQLQSEAQSVQADIKKLYEEMNKRDLTGTEVDRLAKLKAQAVALNDQIEARKKISIGLQGDVELLVLTSKSVGSLTEKERARKAELELITIEEKAQLELKRLHAKILDETITPGEKARVAELTKQLELLDLAAKKVHGTLTPADTDRLAVLVQQTGAIGQQIVAKVEVVKATTDQLKPEKNVTTEVGEQSRALGRVMSEKERIALETAGVQLGAEKTITAELQEQLDIIEEQAAAEAELANFRKGGTIKHEGDVRNLDDKDLSALIAKLGRDLIALKASMGPMPAGYTPIEQLLLQQNLEQARREQAARTIAAQKQRTSPKIPDAVKDVGNGDAAKAAEDAAKKAADAVKKEQEAIEKRWEELVKQEAEREKERAAASAAAKKDADEQARARSLSAKEEAELFALQTKQIETLTAAEVLRMEQLKLQKLELAGQLEIDGLIAKKITDGLTPAEGVRLLTLIEQDKALKEQIAKKGEIAQTTTALATVEKTITAETKEQAKAANLVADAAERELEARKRFEQTQQFFNDGARSPNVPGADDSSTLQTLVRRGTEANEAVAQTLKNMFPDKYGGR